MSQPGRSAEGLEDAKADAAPSRREWNYLGAAVLGFIGLVAVIVLVAVTIRSFV